MDAHRPSPLATGPQAGSASDQLGQRLQQVLACDLRDDALRVGGLVQLSGGASRETWAFEVMHGNGARRQLILRRDPPSAVPGLMRREAVVMEAARRAGVPVPAIVACRLDSDALGAPAIVMEHVEGETLPKRILRDPAYGAIRDRIASECGSLLARIHSIPLTGSLALPVEDPIRRYRGVLDGIGTTRPVFEMAFAWLERNRPVPSAPNPVVLHGDFRLGNLMIAPDGIRAVLDWEMVHAGDPLEDLGWLCIKTWRFGGKLPVAGSGTYDDLGRGYTAASGVPVPAGALHWWVVLNTLKIGIIFMQQAQLHRRGIERSVELAALGRRVCEIEWDLLHLLEGGRVPPPARTADATAAKPALHGRPAADELVEAVEELLVAQALPALAGRLRFHVQVAVRLLRTVRRELEVEPTQQAVAQDWRRRLGIDSEESLARQIRGGVPGSDAAAVRDFVWEMVRMRLCVAHPAYLDDA